MQNLLLAILVNGANVVKQAGEGHTRNPKDSVAYQLVRAFKYPLVWNRLRTIDDWLTLELHADQRCHATHSSRTSTTQLSHA